MSIEVRGYSRSRAWENFFAGQWVATRLFNPRGPCYTGRGEVKLIVTLQWLYVGDTLFYLITGGTGVLLVVGIVQFVRTLRRGKRRGK